MGDILSRLQDLREGYEGKVKEDVEEIDLEELARLKTEEEERIFRESLVNNSNRELLYDSDGTLDRGYVLELPEMDEVGYVTDEQKAKDVRIRRLLDLILSEAIEYRTTDIQISIPTEDVMVRYRIDGKMENFRFIERKAFDALSCRVKHLSGLNISNNRIPQDGRFSYNSVDRVYDVRVSIIPTNKGENISLRLLYSSDLSNNLDSLQIREKVLERYRRAILAREGLILLTGPTASGKTTTLYTTIGELLRTYNNEKNIMTIEDPIEYELDGIVQSQVDLVRNYDFSDGLRSILRQNPDIILVGEIRDKNTAETAVRASNTGHLVFSTLHANDAVSTAIVMKQLGVEPYNISNSLRIVLNQRIIGKVCTSCREKKRVDDIDYFGEIAKEVFNDIEYVYQARGCVECGFTGYRGLVLVIEMLEVTEQFRDLIFMDVTASEMKKQLFGSESYYSLGEDIEFHLRAGNINLRDAIHLM